MKIKTKVTEGKNQTEIIVTNEKNEAVFVLTLREGRGIPAIKAVGGMDGLLTKLRELLTPEEEDLDRLMTPEAKCRDTADVCELAHKRTVRECKKKGIKAPRLDEERYTAKQQDIFDRHYDRICEITNL